MIAAFVLIARHGGWTKAIQQPIADGRWTLPRRLLLAGASLGMLFAVGVTILRFVPGGEIGVDRPKPGNSNATKLEPPRPNDVVSPPAERRDRPHDAERTKD